MRKKYLSALLFGALLFASAGTFTSCKDYDDDISNLNERVDQVVSDLNELKTKVEAMGCVSAVAFQDGKLVITTGDGGTVSADLPECDGIKNVTVTKDGNNYVLDVDGTKTTIEIPEAAEAPEVPNIEVTDDGKLIVGDKEYDLGWDGKVLAIQNTAAGVYTIAVDGQEPITVPMAFADVKIKLEGSGYFTEIGENESSNSSCGIHWARASKEVKWDGPKGDIAANTLVVGQTTAAKVTVRPLNFDLEEASERLSLVSSTGDIAKAKVIVYSSLDEGPLHSVSRAANITTEDLKQGDYVLGIQLNSDLTDRQVIEAFATTDGNHNIKYALALDGVPVTDYDFAIDTQLKADTQTKCEKPQAGKFVIGGMGSVSSGVVTNVPTGTHKMTYLDGRIYDMKVELDESSKADAEVYGVSVDTKAGTITAGSNAIDRKFKLKVTLIDVNGNISSTEVITIQFKKEAPAQTTELDPIAYTVTPLADKSIVINLGNVFSELSSEDAIAILDRDNIDWAIENNDTKFIIDEITLNSFDGESGVAGGITYYSDAACTKEIKATDWENGEAVKSIKYAKIPVTSYNTAATLGEHLLSITLNREVGPVPGDAVGKVIKKVNVPVDVQLPAWEDLFSQPTQTWDSDTYVTRIIDVDETTGAKRAVVSMDAYTAVAGKGADADDIVVTRIAANIGGNVIDVKDTQKAVSNNFNLASSASIADSNGNLPAADMTVDFQYTIGGVSEFTMKETGVKVHIKSIFEDATYVWYDKDGVETTGPAEMNGVDNTIKGTGSEDSDKKSGLALRFSSQNIEIGDLGTANSHFNILGFLGANVQNVISGTPSAANQIQVESAATSDGVSAITITGTPHYGSVKNATPNYTNSFIKLTTTSGMISDNGGTITLTFTDYLGVKTQVVIPFVKKNL